jgi:hypothetical protein
MKEETVTAIGGTTMKSLRKRAHELIDLLPQSDLGEMWAVMETYYYDRYVQRALDSAKRNFRPGDVLDRAAALELLETDDSTLF